MQIPATHRIIAAALALTCGLQSPVQAAPLGVQDPENVASRVTPIVQVVRKVGPTVVNLYADLEIEGGWGFGPQEAGSLGAGVIIHPSGLVVTNAHVITGNMRSHIKSVTVSYRPDWTGANSLEMKQFKAKVIGSDRTNDLALLQIQAEGPFPAARLGTSADLMIGETVIAVGNPLGREGSVTHGIVSATNRSLASPNGDQQFEDLIQTDASLNSGNSGGPLFNILGELIGINQAIASDRQFGRAEGQGLALPVDRVRALLDSEFNPFEMLHSWIGLEVENGDGRGVVVRKVDKDGPATRAGIQVGDLILRVGTYDVADRTAFNLSICSFDPDERIPLALSRDGKRRDITLTPISVTKTIADRVGLSLAGLPVVFVTEVDPDGAAARLGLQRNDQILELGGRKVTSIQDVFEVLRGVKRGEEVTIAVNRYSGNRRGRRLEGELKL